MVITSGSNPLVKRLTALQSKSARDKEGVFIAEGLRFVRELPEGWPTELYACSESFRERFYEEIRMDAPVFVLADKVFSKISDTRTPQGVLALCRKREISPDAFFRSLPEAPLLLVCENVQDPGNLGTMIRTAHAAGADGILLTENCVDVYNPKVLRSTMGSLFHVPVLSGLQTEEVLQKLHDCGIRSFAAHLAGTDMYRNDFRGGTAFLIGNEGNGLRRESSEQASCLLKIPMPGGAESLNAAMAAGILLYEAVRQRR